MRQAAEHGNHVPKIEIPETKPLFAEPARGTAVTEAAFHSLRQSVSPPVSKYLRVSVCCTTPKIMTSFECENWRRGKKPGGA